MLLGISDCRILSQGKAAAEVEFARSLFCDKALLENHSMHNRALQQAVESAGEVQFAGLCHWGIPGLMRLTVIGGNSSSRVLS